ncbi:MAG: SMP-30/gluconolactonase/LRE family protein [Planctomycetaceae bacterium]|nr:SMP-30/gluconolactonase/LRE family protein [Planctomycetaceae bacterium]
MWSPTESPTLDRRQFLKISGAAATAAMTGGRRSLQAKPTNYAGLDSSKYLGKVKIETPIEDKSVFTEGPAVDRNGLVYFTNVPVEKILRWDPEAKKLSVFRENSNSANGLLFDPDGNLLACEGGAGRVTRTDMQTGEITVLAKEYNEFPLAAPNDLTLDEKGRIYFSSRPGGKDPTKGNVNAVYRIDPKPDAEGNYPLTQLLHWPDVHMPNGIVTSPDCRTLYLIEAHPDADHNRNILAFDLDENGNLSNRRTLIDFYPGRSGDGMCIDQEGNLYVAAGLHKTRKTSETLDTKPGIHVISPEGKLLAYAETPVDTVTNCTFGGPDLKTLYVACGKFLVSLPTEIPGKKDYRPKK